jgi:Protein of unknown function (DUF1524)
VRTPRIFAVLLAAALALSGCKPIDATPGAAGASDPSLARQQLAELTVADPLSMAGYSRARFPHWIQQNNGCDTRDLVLKRQGQGVETTGACKIVKGSWLSPYDNQTYTDPQKLDVDHLVPLADAWRSGAKDWTDDRRQDFANDLTRPQLIAVSLTQNRAKGDQDPSQWKPPNHDYWCQYAQDWVTVKHFWQLTVTAGEKTALTDMLGTCRWQSKSA